MPAAASSAVVLSLGRASGRRWGLFVGLLWVKSLIFQGNILTTVGANAIPKKVPEVGFDPQPVESI